MIYLVVDGAEAYAGCKVSLHTAYALFLFELMQATGCQIPCGELSEIVDLAREADRT